MARPQPRRLKVIKSERLTPNMHRITLGGGGLTGFPQDQDGAYIKFMLPTAKGQKPIVRTYTVRRQLEHGLEIDFALHGKTEVSGPATQWALDAKLGDEVLVSGPGPAKPLPEGSGPFLLVGDMTALPAISVNLEFAPQEAQGHVIILIRDEADKQALNMPDNMTLEWIVESKLGANPELLAQAVRRLPKIQGFTYAWVACEFEAMKLLRQYLRVEQQFGKERLYISSYWKRGLVEDEHKDIKRADAKTNS
ncbi:siderophore-interacting protein [Hellea sp.]|nr:siderophore-interacting protein [Hellea sp.]MDA8888564.1 siderophore-interacting protein [Hellea sp.]MDB4844974.1 siderophore-interacting protein [Hellea sp.]MDC0879821.1 siderophore-interacting protein [Hellea sp.]